MGRIYRFRDRQSYKPSELLGLFILSLFGGMILFAILMLINNLIEQVFG